MTTKTTSLASLKNQIKDLASEARAIRTDARTLTGMARYNRRLDADNLAPEARNLQLAYGYLRGRTISQMQSEFTQDFPWGFETAVAALALTYFRPQMEDESDEEYAAAKSELSEFIKNDIKQFKKACHLRCLAREAQLRKVA